MANYCNKNQITKDFKMVTTNNLELCLDVRYGLEIQKDHMAGQLECEVYVNMPSDAG
jgi:hypothetical protein